MLPQTNWSNGGRYSKVATDRGRQRDKVCNCITVVHVGSSVCTVEVELLFSIVDILIQSPLIKMLKGNYVPMYLGHRLLKRCPYLRGNFVQSCPRVSRWSRVVPGGRGREGGYEGAEGEEYDSIVFFKLHILI